MNIEPISTTSAPAAVGPYSQAIRAGDYLFCSGQIPLDPVTGRIESEGIESQTEQVLQNLKAVISAAGGSLANTVKTTVFLKDLKDFEVMNRVYSMHFVGVPPARSTIQVAHLPKDAKVEIEAIVFMGVK